MTGMVPTRLSHTCEAMVFTLIPVVCVVCVAVQAECCVTVPKLSLEQPLLRLLIEHL